MIKCPNCGSNLRFDPKSQQVVCDSCDSKFNPKELNKEGKKAKELEGKLYLCSQCGAELLSFDETAVTFCSYCDSQAMIESKMKDINNPELIIPFKMNMDECIKNYKRKISSALFVPDYMKNSQVVKKFRGIYMPYVICKTEYHGPVSGKGEKYSHSSGNYNFYDLYQITSDADIEYDGVSYDLVSKFYDSYSNAIPFDYKDAVDYNPNFLLGYYADTKDVDINSYDKEAEKFSIDDVPNRFNQVKEYRKYGSKPTVKMKITNRRVGMYPVYFMSVRHNDKIHYAVVNGQTGKVAADLPISPIKYLIGSFLLAIPIFLLLLMLPVIDPKTVVVVSIIASIISFCLSNNQVDKINIKENYLDDIGYQQNLKQEEKEKIKPKKSKLAYGYKQLISIILGIGVLIINPVDDLYYYGIAIIAYILIILSFRTLINEHNILTTRKLPQLAKRGGDESE